MFVGNQISFGSLSWLGARGLDFFKYSCGVFFPPVEELKIALVLRIRN